MRVIVRTVENGARVPVAEVEKRRKAVKDQILAGRQQYTEVEAILGSLNALGQRVEERVYIIEDVMGVNYV